MWVIQAGYRQQILLFLPDQECFACHRQTCTRTWKKVSQRLNGRGKYLKRERAKRCEFRPKEERGQKTVEKNNSKSDGGQINNTFKLKCWYLWEYFFATIWLNNKSVFKTTLWETKQKISPFPPSFLNDVLVVIVTEAATKFLVIHLWLILPDPPPASHLRFLNFNFLNTISDFLHIPMDIAGTAFHEWRRSNGDSNFPWSELLHIHTHTHKYTYPQIHLHAQIK